MKALAVWVASAVVLCGVGISPVLSAAEVRWVAPPICPDSRTVTEEADRLLGRALADVQAVDFEVWINERDDRWSLQLSTVARATGERRVRVLEGKSCDEVTSAAAVALAMVVNSHELTRERDEPPEIESVQQDETPVPPPAQAAPVEQPPESPPSERELRWSVALGGLGDVGALPGLGLGAMANGVASYGALRVGVSGGILVRSHDQRPGQGAEFSLITGGFAACAQRGVASALAWICAGAELGRLSGSGIGVKNPRSGGSLWWAPKAELGGAFPLGGGVALVGQIGLLAPQVRPPFILDGASVYRPAVMDGRLSLGLELSFE